MIAEIVDLALLGMMLSFFAHLVSEVVRLPFRAWRLMRRAGA